jgi:hypothetical protein
VFIASGQIIDEHDTRDGSLISRITSDLAGELSLHTGGTIGYSIDNAAADPVLRVEVSSSSKGQEFLLILSAANEMRVWDLETRVRCGAVPASYPHPPLCLCCCSVPWARFFSVASVPPVQPAAAPSRPSPRPTATRGAWCGTPAAVGPQWRPCTFSDRCWIAAVDKLPFRY